MKFFHENFSVKIFYLNFVQILYADFSMQYNSVLAFRFGMIYEKLVTELLYIFIE